MFQSLTEEAYQYLDSAGACFGTPIERLKQINEPAIAFYQRPLTGKQVSTGFLLWEKSAAAMA